MPLLLLILLILSALRPSAAAEPLPIASLARSKPVDFETEILPFLKQSCLACHNQTKAKADLILETPPSILKGGESGPGVVPGKPGESLILQVAAHLQKPIMPPADNKANAPNLSSEQLGLLKLWIEQGASGEIRGDKSVAWRPLPARVRPILSLALTDDSQLAACSRGNELVLYSLPTRRAIGPLADPELRKSASTNAPAHLDLIESLDFTPDGELLASGSYREVKLWRREHNLPAALDLPDAVSRILKSAALACLSPDSSRLATLSPDNHLQIWDAAHGKVEQERPLEIALRALAWFSDGAKLLTAAGTNVLIWSPDLATNQPIATAQPISFFAGAGHRLVTVTPNEARTWNLTNAETRVLTNFNPGSVTALALSPDGGKLAVASADQPVKWFNLETSGQTELKSDYRFAYRQAQLQRAIARSSSHYAYRKSMLDNAEKERTAQVERVRKASDQAGAAQKALADQQAQLASARTEESGVQKDLSGLQARLKEAQEISEKAQAELAKSKEAAKAAPQDALEAKLTELAVRAASAALASNNLAQLKPEHEKNEKAVQEKIKAAQKKIADAEALVKRGQITNAASENELHFAIAAAQAAADNLTLAQSHLQTAEADRKQLEAQFETAKASATNFITVRQLAFSADGTLLAAASEKGIATLWNAESGAVLDNINLACSPAGLAFRSDGALLSWAPEKLSAWETLPAWKLERAITSANGQPAFSDRVNAVRFSPDGQSLATGSGEPSRSGEIRIWRVRDGQLQQDLKNIHSDSVFALAYSPDGRHLASGGADRFAKITDLSTGKVLRTLEGHTHHVLAVSWKADGHTLITGSADNLVKVWDAFSGEKKKGPEAFGKEVTAVHYIGESDQLVASSGDASLRIFKDNGEKVRSLEGISDFIQGSLASADGTLILAGGQEGVLRVWKTDTTKPIAQFTP